MRLDATLTQAAPTKTTEVLGVGVPYFVGMPPDFYQSGLLDFVEVTPETLCRPRQRGRRTSLELLPDQIKRAQESCGSLPMIVHGVELSIGSAHRWNSAYVEMLDQFYQQWPFLWHSEHLSFQTAPDADGTEVEAGVPLPMPPTREAVELVAGRCVELLERYELPFLLENPAHYLPGLPADAEIGDECGLMRAILEKSNCYQLLDLHNVYCNAINNRLDGFDLVDRMPLQRVMEIHIAGGSWQEGFWADAHDSRVPDLVWQMLEYTLGRAPNVRAIVFELLEQHALSLGTEAIEEELAHARGVWWLSRRNNSCAAR